MEVLKVSSRSSPNSVAGAMAGCIRSAGSVDVQVVGAGALNQAIKAVAIARGFLASSGLDLVCVPSFQDIEIDGEGRTAIRLTLDDRNRRHDAKTASAEPCEVLAIEEPAATVVDLRADADATLLA